MTIIPPKKPNSKDFEASLHTFSIYLFLPAGRQAYELADGEKHQNKDGFNF